MSNARRRAVRLPQLDSSPNANTNRSLTPEALHDPKDEDLVRCSVFSLKFDWY